MKSLKILLILTLIGSVTGLQATTPDLKENSKSLHLQVESQQTDVVSVMTFTVSEIPSIAYLAENFETDLNINPTIKFKSVTEIIAKKKNEPRTLILRTPRDNLRKAFNAS